MAWYLIKMMSATIAASIAPLLGQIADQEPGAAVGAQGVVGVMDNPGGIKITEILAAMKGDAMMTILSVDVIDD